MIQWKIQAGAESVKLAWTPRWLLSPTAIEAILVDPEKRTASAIITVINSKDKDKDIKKGI